MCLFIFVCRFRSQLYDDADWDDAIEGDNNVQDLNEDGEGVSGESDSLIN